MLVVGVGGVGVGIRDWGEGDEGSGFWLFSLKTGMMMEGVLALYWVALEWVCIR